MSHSIAWRHLKPMLRATKCAKADPSEASANSGAPTPEKAVLSVRIAMVAAAWPSAWTPRRLQIVPSWCSAHLAASATVLRTGHGLGSDLGPGVAAPALPAIVVMKGHAVGGSGRDGTFSHNGRFTLGLGV